MSMPEELSLPNPLAIVGNEDMVLGFASLGFKVYPLKEAAGFKAVLDKVIEDKVAICLVQDNLYRQGRDEINNYKNLALPIFMPFSQDKTDLWDSIVRDIRLKATGAF